VGKLSIPCVALLLLYSPNCVEGYSLLKKPLSGRSAVQKRIQHRQTKAETLQKQGL
jgi:hypothetical protein